MELKGKHIVLGISGGIAAYKSAMLLRLLVKEGAEVQVVMTPNAKEFITPVTLSALSGKPVVSEFFTANTGEWHSHVDLGLWADLMVIAPATASTIAKMATGVADNMLITTYLSAREPVMIAPAMDMDMYNHPTTYRNLDNLRKDGVVVLDSPSGELASGLKGKGRMMEPELIVRKIKSHFRETSTPKDLKDKRVIVTAGPTQEMIDPVRYIGNHSSGKMGFALAEEFYYRGAEVMIVCGPVSRLPEYDDGTERRPYRKFEVKRVDSALDMLNVVEYYYDQCDIAVFAAAVADYRPETFSETKIKRENKEKMTLKLVKNPDIAATMGKWKTPRQINVGFALETDNGLRNAEAKMEKKNLDMIVLNPANEENAGFNSDTNRITILSRENKGEELKAQELPLMTKKECAKAIVDEIVEISRIKGSKQS